LTPQGPGGGSGLAPGDVHVYADGELKPYADTVAFWRRAQAFFTGLGITVERVLTDNGSCYRSHAWHEVLAAAGIAHKRTRPYRPQTNGKVERFNRTLLDEWAYLQPYASNAERAEALEPFLHTYNHHRSHTALGGQPPMTRVNNPAGQYT
ncbi:integrase core domain-containing protein, partial [Kitasatospora sp. NPDC057015]|uniref:integrase core domain-containing protein n=1 Tax=Kitasatospora sp. NPDC057015 TaxID=3346001 RepID=UPI00362B1943